MTVANRSHSVLAYSCELSRRSGGVRQPPQPAGLTSVLVGALTRPSTVAGRRYMTICMTIAPANEAHGRTSTDATAALTSAMTCMGARVTCLTRKRSGSSVREPRLAAPSGGDGHEALLIF